jgi:hypothetical protein
MGAVAVAQHLHAIVAAFNYNNVTGGIEREGRRGILELADAYSSAADGAGCSSIDNVLRIDFLVLTIDALRPLDINN